MKKKTEEEKLDDFKLLKKARIDYMIKVSFKPNPDKKIIDAFVRCFKRFEGKNMVYFPEIANYFISAKYVKLIFVFKKKVFPSDRERWKIVAQTDQGECYIDDLFTTEEFKKHIEEGICLYDGSFHDISEATRFKDKSITQSELNFLKQIGVDWKNHPALKEGRIQNV